MSYATGADNALEGMKSSEVRAVTSQPTTNHEDKDKASKATNHHGNAYQQHNGGY